MSDLKETTGHTGETNEHGDEKKEIHLIGRPTVDAGPRYARKSNILFMSDDEFRRLKKLMGC